MNTGTKNPPTEFYNFALAEGEPIYCPICESPMPSLYRLNQHLDSEHSNEDSTQAILGWLKNAQKKVLNPLSKAATLPKIARSKLTDLELNEPQFQENITRDHWQREKNNDFCSNSSCGKPLNIKNGKENCRKCGKLFCDFHTQYQMRLNTSAQHDPTRGYWYRVCEGCYADRDGYLDNEGACRNRTELFVKLRNKTVDKVLLESNRLEKRLDKLARAHSSGALSTAGFFNSIPRMKPQRKSSEQSIVKWEDDNSIKECPFCGVVFGKIRNRRHHCRLCGRVVCGNESCSSNVPLTGNAVMGFYGQNRQAGEVKACRDCRTTISRRKENTDDSTISPIIELYQALSKHRSIIDRTLPKFNQMISILGSISGLTESHMDFQKAAQIRKRLLDSFAQFDGISKKINNLPSNSPWERQLQNNIHLAATHYLQTYMFSLTLLPKLFKKDNDDSSITTTTFGDLQNEPKFEQKKVKNSELLDVLQEQYSQGQGFLHQATKQRRFDDVKLLKQSLNDLAQEMEKLST
ncbi:carboxypeptidase Y-deficient [Basidiobolus ranarum]|uniref:Carboxypeptidase Y-deficient n=1 Tax=Basidiobolus ranarum TaxID=34480 RepID=A0ABR2WRI6_9FUNG